VASWWTGLAAPLLVAGNASQTLCYSKYMNIADVQGAIFDVDDTLLDNNSGVDPERGLHQLSRLAAVHEVGKLRKLPQLESLTPQENVAAFHNAPVHTLEGAVWTILRTKGLVQGEDVDYTNELLLEISALKDATHEAILRAEGKAVPGALAFVQSLVANGLGGKLAIASSAIARDIRIALEITGLEQYFPPNHIISKEQVQAAKPDPESFNLAFATLGLPVEAKSKVLAFEDDPRGMRSAKAAGLYVCAITTRFRRDDMLLQAAQPDLVADSYAEFATLLGLPPLQPPEEAEE
jgi:HAD superfamily hydrolase (TIGR01509 family)